MARSVCGVRAVSIAREAVEEEERREGREKVREIDEMLEWRDAVVPALSSARGGVNPQSGYSKVRRIPGIFS
jgi:hypothetical protein